MYNIYKMAVLGFMGFYHPPTTIPELSGLPMRQPQISINFCKKGAKGVVMITSNHFLLLVS